MWKRDNPSSTHFYEEDFIMRYYHTRIKIHDDMTGKSLLVGGIHTASEELIADWILGGYLKSKDMLIPPKEELVEELKRLPAGGEYRKFYYCYMMVEDMVEDDEEKENDKDFVPSYKSEKPETKNSKIENDINIKIFKRENIITENFKSEKIESKPVQLSIFDIAKS